MPSLRTQLKPTPSHALSRFGTRYPRWTEPKIPMATHDDEGVGSRCLLSPNLLMIADILSVPQSFDGLTDSV